MVERHRCEVHFLEWLRRLSPCSFARAYAGDPESTRILCSVVLEKLSAQDVNGINSLFDAAAEADLFAALIFPRVRSALELAHVLAVLHADDRWCCARERWGTVERGSDVPIGLRWTTSIGVEAPERDGKLYKTSSAMGFAPLGSMPVTRRSPYFAIVVWPGDRKNPFLKHASRDGVGFVDAHPDVSSSDAWQRVRKHTMDAVRIELEDPRDDPKQLREVAFILPREVADPLLANLGLGRGLRNRAIGWWRHGLRRD